MKIPAKEIMVWYVPMFVALSFPLVVCLWMLPNREITPNPANGLLLVVYVLAVPMCAVWLIVQSLAGKTRSNGSRRFAFYSGLGVLALFVAGLLCPAL